MSKECFICSELATDRYTLVLENTEFFEDKLICDDCIPDFQETEWISVYDTPDQITTEESRQDEAGPSRAGSGRERDEQTKNREQDERVREFLVSCPERREEEERME